jgi:hypothetical protein
MRESCPACHLRLERGKQGYIVAAYMFNIIAAELLFRPARPEEFPPPGAT